MTDPRVSAFAAALCAARQARGWSRQQAASQLLLSELQIDSLERDDRSAFYGPAYAERAAMAYAAVLAVDTTLPGGPPFEADRAVDAQATPLLQNLRRPPRVGPQLPRSLFVGLGLVLVVSGGLALRHVLQRTPPPPVAVSSDGQGPAPAEAAPAPAQPPQSAAQDETEAAPAVPAVAASEPPPAVQQTELDVDAEASAEAGDKRLRFYLVINETAVVNAIDGEGRRLLGGRQSPTPGRSYYGTPPFTLQTDNAEAIELYHQGARVRPMPDSRGGFSTRFGASVR